MSASKNSRTSWVARGKKVLSPVLAHYTELEIESGKGAYLIGRNGKRYLDFATGIAVASTGHCHPRVVRAVQKQVEKLIHACAGVVVYEPHIAFAESLLKFGPTGPHKVFFCQSGAEAVEAALKLSRFISRKPGVIAFSGGFHGRTLGSLSVTSSKEKYRKPYEPLLQHVFFAPYPASAFAKRKRQTLDSLLALSLSEVERLLKNQGGLIGAIIVEPIQGEGGYFVPHPDFLSQLTTIAHKYQTLLIFDEVQSGVGRTGTFFAFEQLGGQPDIVTLAKGIASGMPLGVMIARKDLMDAWEPGTHGSTMTGNPVSCAAGLATLEVIRKEKLMKNADQQGKYLIRRLQEIAQDYPFIIEVRGLGLMIAVEIVKSREDLKPDPDRVKAIRKKCLGNGLILISSGHDDSVIRFIPPLTIKRREIEKALSIFEDALRTD